MINQQLLDYVRQQTSQAGISRDEVQKTLLAAGWQALDVDEAFKSLGVSRPAGQPLVVTKPPVSAGAPSQSATATATAAASPLIKKFKLDKKILSIVVAVVVGLSLVGGGVFAYFSYFQSPERIMQKMVEKITEVKSLEYAGDVNLEFNLDTTGLLGDQVSRSATNTDNLTGATSSALSKKTGTISFDFSGSSDWQNPAEFKGLLLLNLKAEIPMFGEPSVGLEVRSVNKDFYAKLSKAPIIMLFDLSSLENQWIKIDGKNITEAETYLNHKLSPAQISQIKEAFVADKVFKVVATLPSEKIDGVSTYHYKYTINKEGLRKYILDVDKIVATSPEFTGKKLEDFNKEMDNLVAPEGEIWVGKKDYLPYKITSNIVINETEKSKVSGNISIMLSAKNYNKPVQVDVPSPVKTTNEIMAGFMRGFGAEGPMLTEMASSSLEEEMARARDARRISDVKQIQVALEMFYNDVNYYPPQASSTLFSSEGQITGANGIYLFKIPVPPTPADGSCPPAGSYNYTYIAGKTPSSSEYRIEYCLSEAFGDSQAGQNFAGPAGISVGSQPKTVNQDISDVDSDNDGLNNYDETLQYKTDPNKPDTDGDGYLDGAEVKGGYNPNGPGKLLK